MDCKQAYNQAADLAEVLELVMSNTTDSRLLCRCTVSHFYRDLAQCCVKQRLPELLTAAALRAHNSDAHHPLIQAWEAMMMQGEPARAPTMNNTVRWLCATAGAEVVGKPEVAQALLSPSMAMTADKLGAPRGGERNGLRWWAWESLASQLARAGVKLNDQLVAAAARQQLPSVKKLFQFEAAPKKSAKSANTSVSKLYQAVVLSDNCTSFTQQLSSASASTVEDLLFIACNECSACWDALIEFDQSNTHLLFDRIDLSQSACENSTQQHAAQHEELLQQLIQTAVVADNGHAAVSLLDSASLTRLISTASLAKLMHVAAQRSSYQDSIKHSSHQTVQRGPVIWLDKLAAIQPAAQGLDADTISSVIKTAVNAAGEYGADFAKLFQLPGARNISADELCSLIQLAGRKEANRVVIRLARLAGVATLDHPRVMSLLTSACEDLGTQEFVIFLKALDTFIPARVITADDTVSLLTLVIQHMESFLSVDPVEIITDMFQALSFNRHSRVHNVDAYTQLLQEVITSFVEPETLEEVLSAIISRNSGPPLSKEQYMQLLRTAMSVNVMPQPLQQLPAAELLTAADVYDLMLECFDRHAPSPSSDSEVDNTQGEDSSISPNCVANLALFSVAQQLSTEQVLLVLRVAVQRCTVDQSAAANDRSKLQREAFESITAVERLLKLPAVKHISAAGAQQLLDAARTSVSTKVRNRLCEHIPACAALCNGQQEQPRQQHQEPQEQQQQHQEPQEQQQQHQEPQEQQQQQHEPQEQQQPRQQHQEHAAPEPPAQALVPMRVGGVTLMVAPGVQQQQPRPWWAEGAPAALMQHMLQRVRMRGAEQEDDGLPAWDYEFDDDYDYCDDLW